MYLLICLHVPKTYIKHRRDYFDDNSNLREESRSPSPMRWSDGERSKSVISISGKKFLPRHLQSISGRVI